MFFFFFRFNKNSCYRTGKPVVRSYGFKSRMKKKGIRKGRVGTSEWVVRKIRL